MLSSSIVGPSTLIDVNMQVRSMGPISEMDMVIYVNIDIHYTNIHIIIRKYVIMEIQGAELVPHFVVKLDFHAYNFDYHDSGTSCFFSIRFR